MSDEKASSPNAPTQHDVAKYHALVNFFPYGVILTCDGQIVEANPAALRMCGASDPKDILGRNWRDLVDAGFHDQLERNRALLRRGETIAPVVFMMKQIDGTTFFAEAQAAPLRIEGKLHFLTTFREITDEREAIAARAESEARFRGVIETAVDGIVLIDAKGEIQLLNPAAARLFGYASEEVVGRNVRMLMPQHYSEKHDEYISNYIETGEAKIIGRGRLVEGLRRDGTTFPMQLSVGETIVNGERYFTGIVRDETLRIRAETLLAESERTYHRLSYMSPAAVLVHIAGRVVFANLMAAQLLESETTDRLIGCDMIDFYHPEHRQWVLDQRAQLMMRGEGETVASEVLLSSLKGRQIFAEGSAATVIWERQPAVLVVLMDLTERKRAEMELTRSNEELQRSNEELGRFAYVASHDLKEPLRMVSSYCELIERRYAGQLDDDGRQFIEYAVDGAKRMQRLIDDLLEYSRIGRGRGGPTDCALGDVVEIAVQNLEAAVQDSDAEIVVGEMPRVTVFRSEFVQLFQNLIGNAIKFRGPNRPKVEISCERTGDFWTIRVQDNGIGIDPRYSERIFGVFQRLHTREAYPGTGIGLAICQKVVTQHGGRIWVESSDGQGSRFGFTVPVLAEHDRQR